MVEYVSSMVGRWVVDKGRWYVCRKEGMWEGTGSGVQWQGRQVAVG